MFRTGCRTLAKMSLLNALVIFNMTSKLRNVFVDLTTYSADCIGDAFWFQKFTPSPPENRQWGTLYYTRQPATRDTLASRTWYTPICHKWHTLAYHTWCTPDRQTAKHGTVLQLAKHGTHRLLNMTHSSMPNIAHTSL